MTFKQRKHMTNTKKNTCGPDQKRGHGPPVPLGRQRAVRLEVSRIFCNAMLRSCHAPIDTTELWVMMI